MDGSVASLMRIRGTSLALLWTLATLAACGGGDSPQLRLFMQFDVTRFSGQGPSPLDPLNTTTIAFEIEMDDVGAVHDTPSPTCPATALYVGNATRRASGPNADLVQRELLDRLDAWSVRLELCDDGAQSSLTVEGSINELNSVFGCGVIPAAAQIKDSSGFPSITTFVATTCNATILDVVNNRVLGGDGFAVTVDTGPEHLP
jgi:hypothetical protein